MRTSGNIFFQLACLATVACAPSMPEVSNAWLRVAPDGSALRVAYLEIRNPGPGDWITGVSSDAHETASLHETVIENGVSRMRHHGKIELPSGATVNFRPGGLHIMLGASTRPLSVGDTVMLALTLESGAVLHARAVLRRQPP